ncbi:hypothetical protein BGZ60DRAFT_415123 [Tricladium varicosporioides]|nr:hypothetical protein BGZ60DRAFT_415123 [Hymenoscyphus varicosporioides]
MPITELAIASIKQDEDTREAFVNTVFPILLSLVDGKKGMKFRTAGKMLSLNDVDVSSEFRPVLGLGWDAVSDFQAVVTAESFSTFKTAVMPLVTAPAFPELYETDVLPLSVYGSTLTEVFKVKVGDDEEKLENAKEAWKNFVGAMKEVKSLNGVSANMEHRTFLGLIGWESEQSREKALRSDGVENLKGCLVNVESFLVKFGGF